MDMVICRLRQPEFEIMKKTAISLALCLFIAAPVQAQVKDGVFEPGLISNGGVFGLTLSPDGKHALYVHSGGRREALTIMEARMVGGKWQAPTIAPFSGNAAWKDIDPVFTPDGKTIIYQSNRAVPGKPERTGFDIWSVSVTAAGWGQPTHLGNVINTDLSESSASVARNGNIYFQKPTSSDTAHQDLWVSRFSGGQYGVPENLGAPVNTSQFRESNPFVAPDESYLIYFSDDTGRAFDVDLMISFRGKDGSWGKPKKLGAPFISDGAEFTPWVHDGRLYFTRQVKLEGRSTMTEDIMSFPFDPAKYAD
jgi:hypothetical protein